jgi:hypothetical protein
MNTSRFFKPARFVLFFTLLLAAACDQHSDTGKNITLPDAQPAASLSDPAVSPNTTATGLFYPALGWPLNVCGKWLGQSSPHGCYLSGYYHIGFDMMNGAGSPVYAISRGTVVRVSLNGWGSGNVALLIRHTLEDGTEYVALYGHIVTSLREGDRVSGGVEIGTVGYWSGGNHLHFGVLPNTAIPASNLGMMPNSSWPYTNGFVDPLNWIDTRRSKCENGTAERYRPRGWLPLHPNGSLLQVWGDPTVYVLVGGYRRAIPSVERLHELYGPGRGFDFRDVITISAEEMNRYPRGADVSGPLPLDRWREPDGRLIRQQGSGEIAIVSDNGFRRPFSNVKAFLALGYTFCNVAEVTDYYSYPLGAIISE